jgi:hypothetical protein
MARLIILLKLLSVERDCFLPSLEKLGFSTSSVEVDADVYVRVQRNDESVFRGMVLNNGVPACDILHVWLDVAQHPSRDKEQADLIWRKMSPVLLPKEKH